MWSMRNSMLGQLLFYEGFVILLLFGFIFYYHQIKFCRDLFYQTGSFATSKYPSPFSCTTLLAPPNTLSIYCK